MSESLSKLGLGTAQWGLAYGISNQSGQTTQEEVSRILNFARDSGINVIDTAWSYGHAEQVLGTNDLSGFNVITKLPALDNLRMDHHSLKDCLESSFANSLTSIGVDSLHGLLIHSCDDLFSQSGSLICNS